MAMIAAVPISEPMTLITDLLVAGVATLCGRALWRRNDEQPSTARAYWAAALFALAATALAGGLAHGFGQSVPAWLEFGLWRTVFFGMGLASFAMVVGAAYAVLVAPLRGFVLLLAMVGFVVYALRARATVDFRLAIAGYTVALAAVGIVAAVSLLRNRQVTTMRWWLLAIGVTAAASLVQQNRVSLHPNFNHNDLYHVLGVLAVLAFYFGARQVEDADANVSAVQVDADPEVDVDVGVRAPSSSSTGETDSDNPPDLEVDSQTSG